MCDSILDADSQQAGLEICVPQEKRKPYGRGVHPWWPWCFRCDDRQYLYDEKRFSHLIKSGREISQHKVIAFLTQNKGGNTVARTTGDEVVNCFWIVVTTTRGSDQPNKQLWIVKADFIIVHKRWNCGVFLHVVVLNVEIDGVGFKGTHCTTTIFLGTCRRKILLQAVDRGDRSKKKEKYRLTYANKITSWIPDVVSEFNTISIIPTPSPWSLTPFWLN